MERVAIDVVEPLATDDGVDRRKLSEPLGATDVAVNRYVVGPGERISGLHAHPDQEEVFLVLDGAVTFETLGEDGDDPREVGVVAGEAVRFAPGEFQSGKNDADREAVVLALGAPPDGGDVRIPLPCPECGRGSMRPAFEGDREVLGCPECGAERSAACPACGREALYAALSGDGSSVVSVCRHCGAETDP